MKTFIALAGFCLFLVSPRASALNITMTMTVDSSTIGTVGSSITADMGLSDEFLQYAGTRGPGSYFGRRGELGFTVSPLLFFINGGGLSLLCNPFTQIGVTIEDGSSDHLRMYGETMNGVGHIGSGYPKR